ncbi:hypothetical protein [Halovivax limisalsi]|uniref:hypothetical protein n=1 Tax=Halovivax limisalsi TaxID=1453760 RepID=UPI001FFD5633|nr:hypothetical protein [Halovivax limisalsi]
MIVVVFVDPPETGRRYVEALLDADVVDPPEARTLYESAVTDVLRAARDSSAAVLVNYREPDGVSDPEDRVRSLVSTVIDDPDDVRFERQVGSSRSARVGNTVTHLLEREDEVSVALLEPTVPLVRRTEIDGVMMSVRRNEVVLGSNAAGDVYLSAYSQPIDFTDAYEPPTLATVTERASVEGLAVGFAPTIPTIETEAGLAATVATIEARAAAGKPIPVSTSEAIEDLGLRTADGRTVTRD